MLTFVVVFIALLLRIAVEIIHCRLIVMNKRFHYFSLHLTFWEVMTSSVYWGGATRLTQFGKPDN